MRGAPSGNKRFARRAGRHLWLGAILGTVAGALLGLVIGSIAFGSARAVWGSVAAGAIFIGGVSTFVAGISSLEPPRPGRELDTGDQDPAPDARDASGEASPLVVEEPMRRPEAGSEEGGTEER
jgi:hypothetical protein